MDPNRLAAGARPHQGAATCGQARAGVCVGQGTEPVLCCVFTLRIFVLRLGFYLIFSFLLVGLHIEAIFVWFCFVFWLRHVA